MLTGFRYSTLRPQCAEALTSAVAKIVFPTFVFAPKIWWTGKCRYRKVIREDGGGFTVREVASVGNAIKIGVFNVVVLHVESKTVINSVSGEWAMRLLPTKNR